MLPGRPGADTAAVPDAAGAVASRPGAAAPYPGFDGLRLLAALGVLLSHAFLIPTGAEHHDALVRQLGRIGYHGVYAFFIISGFLLARALAREPDALRFAVNRVLRIYPGLLACALVTAFVIGPLGSALPWLDYMMHPDARTYVLLTADCLCARGWLPGVFAYAGFDDMAGIVNGSLWSLSYEVLSYLLLLGLWLTLRSVRATVAAMALLCAATLALPLVHERLAGVAFTLPYFTGGLLMYAVQQRFGLQGLVAAGCAAVLALATHFGAGGLAFASLGAYLIVYLGTLPNPGSALAARVGDLSYGIYLYGWPVQQLIKQFTGTTNPWLMLALCVPAVWLLALLSFRLVERPALRLKAPLTALLRRAFEPADAAQRRAVRRASTVAFVAATGVVLLSPQALWWYVGSSLAAVAAASALAAALALATLRARTRWSLLRSGVR